MWVIGARGLLGSGICRSIDQSRSFELYPSLPLPWQSDSLLGASAREIASSLFSAAARRNLRWAIIWAAGASVTSSSNEALEHELRQLSLVLDSINQESEFRDSFPKGTIFLASSAGGVYGGSADPPFDEGTLPAPISRYGAFKVESEHRLFDFSRESGVPAIAGRISNLYGPGQRMAKLQGLISHLAKAQYTARPVAIFVPLETMRDYIYVDDCARLILDSVDRMQTESGHDGNRQIVKNLASGQSVTIGSLLGHFRQITKKAPNAMIGYSAESSVQALDLRVRSIVWEDLDERELTPLPAGISAVLQDVLGHIQSAR